MAAVRLILSLFKNVCPTKAAPSPPLSEGCPKASRAPRLEGEHIDFQCVFLKVCVQTHVLLRFFLIAKHPPQEGQRVEATGFYTYLKLLKIFSGCARSSRSGVINCGTDPPFHARRGQDDGL